MTQISESSGVQRGFSPPHLTFAGMSQSVRCGGLVLVSGQVALGDDGTVVSDDPRDQAEQCFANIESALSLAGARVSDVVKLVCYLTDASYFGAYSDARAKCLGDNSPAGTAVVVASLLDPAMLMEVEAWAVVPQPD
ncbi:RidA family protein [Rhodococcus sp. TAF43]|uniref:RidA family protein n=1 Tax=unclassified Rhodococcus (in: high G+C Gram-positive bacteria) TaxID=192944 RepID=UPI000E0C7F84|nr:MULTISPECIES: RidA family protein [unclassified Rhodococcus (in: high G+C Gram-positive bacteria)]QKT10162.1 RidA family protein [Rhodococcus sp. W8901]RDI30290.1 enamine deaminase RidA (YjgF/YER057c/UK114 family) [Rhodococcus sp. AG1013]